MNKNRIIGSGKQIEGNIKEVIGKVLGDAKLQEDGKAEQVEGKAQNQAGSNEETQKSS